MKQVEIDCIDCEGTGWTISYDYNNKNLPEQITCDTCVGQKKITVDEEFAKFLEECFR